MFRLSSKTNLLFFFLATAIGQGVVADNPADWERVAVESAGLDGNELSDLIADLHADTYPNIHSLLIVRKGKLALEEYFSGDDERRGEPIGEIEFDAETLHDMRSITKSVTSILFGIAVDNKTIADVDAPVLDYFPEYKDLRTPERMTIRLRDLLSMTSGLAWDEDSVPYGDPANSETAMDLSDDSTRFVLEQDVVVGPGREFTYNGGNTMLLAAVIERASGMKLNEYAEQALFGPLGITEYEWLTYPDGTLIAASGLRLLPRDAAKLGQLFLDGGRWRGQQIVSEAWVRESHFPHAIVSNRVTGFLRYGYQWWIGAARVGDDIVPFAAGVGWGGQRILIVPSMDLVVVLTAGLYQSHLQTDITFEVLLDRVLPAVKIDR